MSRISHVSRRNFLRTSAAGAGAVCAGGCRVFDGAAGASALGPNYWCTWATQARMLNANVEAGEIKFPGDQGKPGVRDNLNEEVLFGKNGFANVMYPELRADLFFLLDDGWDVPYGINPYAHTAKFGSLNLNPDRFPSFKGSPGERLRQLVDRVRGFGWRGAGVWVACQSPGESWSFHLKKGQLEEDLKKKLAWSAEAGVSYWKVDWGAHDGDIAYRARMTDLRNSYAPGLLLEHCRNFGGVPLNGCSLGWEGQKKVLNVGSGRIIGSFTETRQKEVEQVLACSDVYRVYDMIAPLLYPSAIERAAYYGSVADRCGARAFINVEDVPYLGATLGHSLGIMRAPIWPVNEKEDSTYRRDRTGEVTRAVVWQRCAPPFAARADVPTRYSEVALKDVWTFPLDSTWYQPVWGRTCHQSAPAAVTRGMDAMPVVKDAGNGVPFVTAMRHPNGAVAVGAHPRVSNEKGFHFPAADVYVPTPVRAGMPIALFGTFNSVSFDCPEKPSAVYAEDLAGGQRHNLTAACRFADGRLTLPGKELARIGTEALADRSQPGVRMTLRGSWL